MDKIIHKNRYLLFEFLLLFLGIPLFLFLKSDLIHPSIVLLPFMVFISILLRLSKKFNWHELWYFRIKKDMILKQLGIVAAIILLMFCWVYLFDRKNLFNLPSQNLKIWLMIICFYPVFSAYTQEIIFRTFIFKRYRRLFKNEQIMIFASACVFSFAHLFYYHPVSMTLTFLLGIYMGWIYQKTHSVIFAAILHGLIGIAVFTIGLGQYFWIDMNKWL